MSDGDITLLYAIADDRRRLQLLLSAELMIRRKETARKNGGITVLVLIPLYYCSFAFLTLSYSTTLIITGMVIFGIVMGNTKLLCGLR
jgi:uncharacterized membrane protein YhaH (DUF805 family)